MSDLFISYSRKDRAFVEQLSAALVDAGRDVWVDWEDIPPSAEWRLEIQTAIEGADAFLFVISPDSLSSKVCAEELAHAVSQNKRLIPLLHRDPAGVSLPEALSRLNYIHGRSQDPFDQLVQTLLQTLDTDLAHVRAHTRLLVRAREWETRQRIDSYLLRGEDLREAEAWLAISGAKEPHPTALHAGYIAASREAETRRQRRLLTAAAAALVVMTVLAALAVWQAGVATRREQARATQQAIAEANEQLANQREQARATQQAIAEHQSNVATSRYLALQSLEQQDQDPSLGQLLSVEAYQHSPTNQALGALLTTLQRKPHLAAAIHSGYQDILNLVFSQDGSKFAIIGCNNFKLSRGCSGPEMLVFDPQTGRSIGNPAADFPSSDGMISLAFSPDGSRLAAWSGIEAVLFQPDTGQVLDRVGRDEIQGQVERLSLSPDGDSFLIDSPGVAALNWHFTGLSGEIQPAPGDEFAADPFEQALYDLTPRGLLGQPLDAGGAPFLALAFKGDALQGVVQQDDSLFLWDISADKPASAPVQAASSDASLSRELQTAVIFDGQDGISLWGLESADLQTIQVPLTWVQDDFSGISQFALSPGGELLAVGYTGFHHNLPLDLAYGLRVFELPSGQLIGEYLQPPEIGPLSTENFTDLEFTPGGMLAAAYNDGSVYILDPENGALQVSGNLEPATALGFSPDRGRLAAGHRSGTVSLWEAASLTPIGELRGYASPVISLTFSPDGQLLLSSHEDGALVAWDLRFETLKERACRQANRNLTQDEWQQYLPAEPYRSTCPDQPPRLAELPGAPLQFNLPERLVQRLPDSALPEALQNILPFNLLFGELPAGDAGLAIQPSATPTSTPPTAQAPVLSPPASRGFCDASPPPCTYLVKAGDSFSLIATTVYGSQEYTPLLLSANRDAAGYRPALSVGMPLLVPDPEAAGLDALHMSLYPECGAGIFPCWYRLSAGDTYSSIAARFYGDETAWQSITQANWVYNPALDNPLTYPEISPGLLLVLPAR